MLGAASATVHLLNALCILKHVPLIRQDAAADGARPRLHFAANLGLGLMAQQRDTLCSSMTHNIPHAAAQHSSLTSIVYRPNLQVIAAPRLAVPRQRCNAK